MKILVIDDSKTVRKSLHVVLKNSNHEIFEAENGIEGLAKAFDIKPNLIFIDVMMPRLDGFQLCQVLKKRPWAKEMFLCMLTGKDTLLDRAKVKNYGADFLIIKPFNSKNLIDFITKIENKTFSEKISLS
ncbi:response regulator [archaeon]|nr:response regulator [archaeon]